MRESAQFYLESAQQSAQRRLFAPIYHRKVVKSAQRQRAVAGSESAQTQAALGLNQRRTGCADSNLANRRKSAQSAHQKPEHIAEIVARIMARVRLARRAKPLTMSAALDAPPAPAPLGSNSHA